MADYDVVVIGSGSGGLTAATALARAGRKVLVLEKHELPGGWCQTFALEGRRFSPGVHYIGNMGPGQSSRRLFEGLGLGADLQFSELNPDGFDHVRVGETRFDIPKGKEELERRLCAAFPKEAAGIRDYMEAVAALGRDLETVSSCRAAFDWLSLPVRAPSLARWGWRSTRSFLDSFVKDPVLKAVLASQAGDHGLPPGLAPAVVHAAVVCHYFNGGFYPRGGGGAIPRALIASLRRAGGAIRTGCAVTRILVEDGKAAGVALEDGTKITAKWVISNADPAMTFGSLLGTQNLSKSLRKKVENARWSVSALSLFLATDLDLRGMGLDSGNYWQYEHSDLDRIYGAPRVELAEGRPEGFFLTATTLKDPSKFKGEHTMEVFTFCPYGAFAKWEATAADERPPEYEMLKRRLSERMLEAAESLIPGLSKRTTFQALGTPLTNVRFVNSARGSLYGTEKTLDQLGPWSFGAQTEVPGLLLCGASTLSHGVVGAAVSGLNAAARIEGCEPSDLLQSGGPQLEIYPAEDPSAWPAKLMARAPGKKEPA